MQIGSQKVVSIEYTLKNDAGEVLDSSAGGEPLAYLHGVGHIVPGLEKALDGKSEGESVEVTLAPEEAYGQRDDTLVQNVPVRKLGAKKVQVGGRYQVKTSDGLRIVHVTELRGDYARVDGNHPLAGQTLHFQVKVVGVREATAEELAHGHVHGPSGHHEH
jgi:FKBP-type peptidyl-prolyl cis-trans isomerase SlyD